MTTLVLYTVGTDISESEPSSQDDFEAGREYWIPWALLASLFAMQLVLHLALGISFFKTMDPTPLPSDDAKELTYNDAEKQREEDNRL